MAACYEEQISNGRMTVTVCVPHDLYGEFLGVVKTENLSKEEWNTWTIKSLRPDVKRLTKGAISYQDFRGAYF